MRDLVSFRPSVSDAERDQLLQVGVLGAVGVWGVGGCAPGWAGPQMQPNGRGSYLADVKIASLAAQPLLRLLEELATTTIAKELLVLVANDKVRK